MQQAHQIEVVQALPVPAALLRDLPRALGDALGVSGHAGLHVDGVGQRAHRAQQGLALGLLLGLLRPLPGHLVLVQVDLAGLPGNLRHVAVLRLGPALHQAVDDGVDARLVHLRQQQEDLVGADLHHDVAVPERLLHDRAEAGDDVGAGLLVRVLGADVDGEQRPVGDAVVPLQIAVHIAVDVDEGVAAHPHRVGRDVPLLQDHRDGIQRQRPGGIGEADLRAALQDAAALALLLRLVQRLVGQVEELAVLPALGGHDRGADGDADGELQPVAQKLRHHAEIIVVDALGEIGQLVFGLHVPGEDEELVAADAPADVLRTHVVLQQVGEQDQDAVAHVVAEEVVEQLEGVQVQHAEQARFRAADVADAVLRGALVQKAGHAVGHGLALELDELLMGAQRLLDAADQDVRVDGLADAVDGAHLQALGLALLLLVGGEEDDRDLGDAAVHLLQPAHGLEPVHDRHVHVQQDQVGEGNRALEELQERHAGLQRGHADAVVPQDLPRELQILEHVINDYDPFHEMRLLLFRARRRAARPRLYPVYRKTITFSQSRKLNCNTLLSDSSISFCVKTTGK